MTNYLRGSGSTLTSMLRSVALIALIGAVMLMFAEAEPGAAAEVGEGESALRTADAGVEAARKQIQSDPSPSSYDGGTDDVQWSKSRSGTTLKDLDGDADPADEANVQIEYKPLPVDTFIVTSTGRYGGTTRKVEAAFRKTGPIKSIPPAYFTQSNLSIVSNFSARGTSFFAQGSLDVSSRSVSFGTVNDVMGKWAQTSDSGSFPNPYNGTPRSSMLPGLAAQKGITTTTVAASAAPKGTNSFDAATSPRVVPDYHRSTLAGSQKIAFPFSTGELARDLETLRKVAQRQQAENPSENHYRDNLSGTFSITSWPTGGDYDDVYYFRFPVYNSTNVVRWDLALPCTDHTRRGVIVVENGSFLLSTNRGGFSGTVVVYGGTSPYAGQPYPPRGGFRSSGGSCMHGYATSSGDMILAGNYDAGSVPGLTNLRAFDGRLDLVQRRELYVAADDRASTDEDIPVSVDVLENDHNPQGSPPSLRLLKPPAHGKATQAADGRISYSPNGDFNGTDGFSYAVSDGGSESTATVTVEVAPVNDAPRFTAGPDGTVDEDAGPQEVASWATGISAGPEDEAGQGLRFAVANDNPTLFDAEGQPTVSPEGTLTYRPAKDASGTANVSVTLADDGGTDRGGIDESAARPFVLTVRPINDAPVARDDFARTEKETPVTIDALANDTDAEGDALTVTDVSKPAHGLVSVGGDRTLRYAPDPAYVGTDSFTYRVGDGSARSDPATVSVTVQDTVAPGTSLTSGPSDAVKATSASFAFSSNEAGANFECSLDRDAFKPCVSPTSYADLADGVHTFRVRARDAGLNADPSPVSRTWRVDTVGPRGSVVIDDGAARTRGRTVTLAAKATDPAPASGITSMRFKNAGATAWSNWEPYSTSKSWTLKSWVGTKTVYVQYRDKAGNVSAAAYDEITYLPYP